MGIVGLQITHAEIQNEFNRITNTCSTDGCQICGSPGFDCYIINQAGMVLVSNVGEKEVGQSLKEINCALVEDLVNRSILNQTYLYDFQGICIETVQETYNFGNRLYPPFQMIMKLMMWFINEIVLCMLGFVDDLLSYKVTIGQKWGLYAEPHKSVDTETISFYENARHIIINNEDNIPREDFLIHQNPIYHGIDENANMNNNFQDLSSDEHFQSLNTLNQRSYSNDKVITPMRNNTLIENQSIIDSVSKLTITESIELREEPIDEIYGRFDHQDPYDAQLKALTAIETCRKEQSAQIQSILDSQSETVNIYNHSNMDEVLNETESLITGTTISNSIHLGSGILGKGGKLIPGSLLACVHRSVQQRCHSGAGTSSFTGRYACEAICEIVRERMPQLANRLEDCKQPLISCTERFIAFNVMIGKHLKQSTAIHKQTIYNTQTSTNGMLYETQFTGEYCNECGGR
ncbi:unnamed protein product [Heterobilharzia americana]|nr:unnamed protein product [Heterobilharzia americana]